MPESRKSKRAKKLVRWYVLTPAGPAGPHPSKAAAKLIGDAYGWKIVLAPPPGEE